MTEREKIAAAIRRLVERMRRRPWETNIETALLELAEEIDSSVAEEGHASGEKARDS